MPPHRCAASGIFGPAERIIMSLFKAPGEGTVNATDRISPGFAHKKDGNSRPSPPGSTPQKRRSNGHIKAQF